MRTEERKPSTEWLRTPEYAGVVIMDPDGWDRRNLAASMAEPITLEEFKRRLWRSTHMIEYPREAPNRAITSAAKSVLPQLELVKEAARLQAQRSYATTAQIGVSGPVNGMDEKDPKGFYILVRITDRDGERVHRISRGAAEVLAAEITGLLGGE